MLEEFNKNYRLLNKNDFDSLRDQSHFLFSNTLIAFYKKNNLEKTRIGLSISKKYGNAVKRNKLKRLIREYFRKSKFKDLSIDINIVANSKFIKKRSLSCKDIEMSLSADLNNLFSSINK